MPKIQDPEELRLIREMYLEGDPTKDYTEEELLAKERREAYRRSQSKTKRTVNQAR